MFSICGNMFVECYVRDGKMAREYSEKHTYLYTSSNRLFSHFSPVNFRFSTTFLGARLRTNVYYYKEHKTRAKRTLSAVKLLFLP